MKYLRNKKSSLADLYLQRFGNNLCRKYNSDFVFFKVCGYCSNPLYFCGINFSINNKNVVQTPCLSLALMNYCCGTSYLWYLRQQIYIAAELKSEYCRISASYLSNALSNSIVISFYDQKRNDSYINSSLKEWRTFL